jgi:hypothetical protein
LTNQYKDRFGFIHTIPQTDRDKQLERDALQWKKYFKDNQGKIPNRMPKTIFDKDNANTERNVQE